MMRKLLTLGLAALMAGSLAGCNKKNCDPQPACYFGTVALNTCENGWLIDVAPVYRIGAPAHSGYDSTLVGNNVIVVVNSDKIGNVQVGQRLYFTATTAPNHQWTGRLCLAHDGVEDSVPKLILSNVSTTACDMASAH